MKIALIALYFLSNFTCYKSQWHGQYHNYSILIGEFLLNKHQVVGEFWNQAFRGFKCSWCFNNSSREELSRALSTFTNSKNYFVGFANIRSGRRRSEVFRRRRLATLVKPSFRSLAGKHAFAENGWRVVAFVVKIMKGSRGNCASEGSMSIDFGVGFMDFSSSVVEEDGQNRALHRASLRTTFSKKVYVIFGTKYFCLYVCVYACIVIILCLIFEVLRTSKRNMWRKNFSSTIEKYRFPFGNSSSIISTKIYNMMHLVFQKRLKEKKMDTYIYAYIIYGFLKLPHHEKLES